MEEVNLLAEEMLTSFASYCRLHHGDRPLPTPEVNILKTKLLIEILQIKSETPLTLPLVHEALTRFARGTDRSTLHRMSSGLSSIVSSSDPIDSLSVLKNALAEEDFTLEERLELAKLIIRKHDSEHSAHCAQQNCGEECDFAPAHCSHEGNSTRVLWSYCTSENLLHYYGDDDRLSADDVSQVEEEARGRVRVPHRSVPATMW